MAISEKNTSCSAIKFEKLQLTDEEEYIFFLKEAYKNTFNSYRYQHDAQIKEMWRWEYLNYPYLLKKEPYIYICRYEGSVIAQVCAMPCAFKLYDQMIKSVWVQDLMILDRYRNMGLGFYLMRYMLEQLRSEFQCVLVSGTNKNSYPLFKRFGFLEIGWMSKFIKPINGSAIAKRLTHNFFARKILDFILKEWGAIFGLYNFFYQQKDIVISEIKKLDDEFDQLWKRVSQRISFVTLRDRFVMQWRWCDHPLYTYKVWVARQGKYLKGYVIVREEELSTSPLKGLKVAIISDLFFDLQEKKIGTSLLKNIIHMYKGRVDLLRCDLYSSEMQSFLRKEGFIGIKSQHRFLIYALQDDCKKHIEQAVKSKKGWHLTYGDSDFDV